ncbi:MAG: nuclear transport factor 2 family protein [Chloroflexi bacterium]|nr:nuclear transport factor 2 family protein [Chloroflexota bacterium]MDA1146686.1 nuclear transport factor 2 family protein [Chloroflexota bacterium]
MVTSELEDRLRLVEDEQAIRRLKAFYAKSADSKYTDDHRRKPQAEIDAITRRQIDTVFTEDGVWDGGGQFGEIRGRDAIYEHLRLGRWSFSMHYFVSPHIELDGDTAHGTWMLWQPCTLAEGNRSMLMSATTEDDYVRTESGWQMSRYTFRLKFLVPHDQPWSVNRNAPFRG